MRSLYCLVLAALAFVVVSSDPALAAWTPDGVVMCAAAGHQIVPKIVSDGAGGAIVTWYDNRNDPDLDGDKYDIYVQRVDALGSSQWSLNGVSVCSADSIQLVPAIASDGAGGAIIAWYDYRNGNYDIYAQRVNASGAPQWAADGIALCVAANRQSFPTVFSDGVGGAIIAWMDARSDNSYDIYAQRVDANGTAQWPTNGIAVCNKPSTQSGPTIATDGAGGVIMTWYDFRNGNYDIYAQRVSNSGSSRWVTNGVALCTAPNDQYAPRIVSDGAGGAIVTWSDYRSDDYADVYIQRIDASGNTVWTQNGNAVCTLANDQIEAMIVSDGAGGAVIAWRDHRNGYSDIYAQRVSATGNMHWAANGVGLCTAPNAQEQLAIVSNGAGSAIVAWYDIRNGISYDIYAQKVDATGTPQWIPDGIALCTENHPQSNAAIAPDGAGGAIVTWQDRRNETDYDIYAQRVRSDGSILTDVGNTHSAAPLVLTYNSPNPFSTGTRIDLSLAVDANVEIELYDVAGRRVRKMNLGRLSKGSRQINFDGNGENGNPLASGVYFYRVTANGTMVTNKMIIAR